MRWVSWAAVSSLPQAKKISNEDQLAENRRHAEKHGGNVVAELVVPGESRSIVLFEDAARRIEAYAELKRLVDAKAFDVLVYLDRSRLGRKASLSMSVVELCHSAGIATYETENPPASITATDSHDDALIGAIKSVGAQREIDKLKRRHEMGMMDRVRRGKFPGPLPFGYVRRFQPDGSSVVEVDAAAVPVIRQVMALYLSGHSLPQIADIMAQRNAPTASGNDWTRITVRLIVGKAWIYAGYVEVNKRGSRQYIRAQGEHATIIDADTAEAVDVERNARLANRKLGDTDYMLSGVVMCAECGKPMHCVGEERTRDGRTYTYVGLRCIRHRPTRHCSYRRAERVLRRAIEAIDEQAIEELINDDDGLSDMLLSQIAEQEATIERTEAALRRVDDAMVDGMIDGDRYRRQVDRLNAQAATARAEIARLRQRYDDEADRDKRRERMQQVSAIGLAMLDEPPHVANAWLRRNVRLWCKDGRIVVVDWL